MTDANQPWWSMPLPQGWEAKYDQANQRYFFINHQSHQTTWQDPRQALWKAEQASLQPLRPPPAQTRPSPQIQRPSRVAGVNPTSSHRGSPMRGTPASSHSPNPSAPKRPTENIPLKELKPQWQREVENKFDIDADLMRENVQNETSLSHLYEKMQIMFPFAEADVIHSLLSSNYNSEQRTMKNLLDMGYKKQDTATQNRITTHIDQLKHSHPNMTATEMQEAVLNALSETRASSANTPTLPYGPTRRSQTPTRGQATPTRGQATPTRGYATPSVGTPSSSVSKPELSDAEKNAVKGRMEALFKNEAKGVVEMALEACHYDFTRTKMLLTSMGSERDSNAMSNKKSNQQKNSVSSESSKSSGSVSSPSRPAPNVSQPSPMSQPTKSTPSIAPTAPPKTQVKTVTVTVKRSPVKQSSPAAKTNIMYHSPTCMKPNGPDSKLVKGPNLDHLIDHYVEAVGPDKCNRKGPVKTNAHGPERSNRTGPQYRNSYGPSRENVVGAVKANVNGPMKTTGRLKSNVLGAKASKGNGAARFANGPRANNTSGPAPINIQPPAYKFIGGGTSTAL